MEEYNVAYQGGTSRKGNEVIDFMLAKIPSGNGEVELYAEAENDTWNEDTETFEDESATYEILKLEIIKQAEENGINIESLHFWFDKE